LLSRIPRVFDDGGWGFHQLTRILYEDHA
jgi:hypothetical protein